MDYNVNAEKRSIFAHICGQCKMGFKTEEDYIKHLCVETGFTPADPEHHGEEFLNVQKFALKRGEIRKQLEGQGIDPETAKRQAHTQVSKMSLEEVTGTQEDSTQPDVPSMPTTPTK
jgi:hypothetical protein